MGVKIIYFMVFYLWFYQFVFWMAKFGQKNLHYTYELTECLMFINESKLMFSIFYFLVFCSWKLINEFKMFKHLMSLNVWMFNYLYKKLNKEIVI